MVNIYCDTIDDELKQVARCIAQRQKMDVIIITPTTQLEVRYDESLNEDVG